MSRAKTILLVEDNPDDVELTMRAFERSRLPSDVVVASDGEAALDYLFSTGQHQGRDPVSDPTVVLLDLNLPKVSGLDVLRRMRARESTRHTPVVVLTSSNEERDIMNSYGLGANSFVRKPVDFTEFLEAAKNLGVYWLVLNQPPVSVR